VTRQIRLTILAALAVLPLASADWNPRLAAQYLDSRQREWLEWKTAKAPGGSCVSCHTNATYLLARPALRRALGESQPTSYETDLLASLRARVSITEPTRLSPTFPKEPLASQAYGVEAIFAALFLSRDNPESPESIAARKRMWSAQLREGEFKGTWQWFSLKLDPWEMAESRFYGATVAALVTGASNDPSQRAELAEYLRKEQRNQPMHNRLMLLSASSKIPSAMSAEQRAAILDEAWKEQQPDGGWTIQSIGPWKENPTAPVSKGSNSYATGFVAYSLEQAGVAATDPRLARSLAWLKPHQDSESGAWPAESMNKHFEPGSMQSKFMMDAATAYAAMALLGQ
jgi:squalene-hopene/tetraprenyl-beta-curcumene cyclase